MDHLPSISALAVVLVAAITLPAARAADSSADSKYSYRPYSQQNQAGSDAANSPANSSGRVPAEPSYARPGDAGTQAAAPTDRNDAWRAPPPGQLNEDDRDDQGGVDVRAGRPLPPPAGEAPPPAGYAASRLLEATASAPDRSVPYNVREQDARRAAIEAWRSKATARFGPEFSHWRFADRRQVDCRRNSSDDAICTVRGVPTRDDAQFNRRDPDDRD